MCILEVLQACWTHVLPHKHLQSKHCILEYLKSYMVASVSASLRSSSMHSRVHWYALLPRPIVDRQNSVELVTGICIASPACMFNLIQFNVWSKQSKDPLVKTLPHSPTSGKSPQGTFKPTLSVCCCWNVYAAVPLHHPSATSAKAPAIYKPLFLINWCNRPGPLVVPFLNFNNAKVLYC